MIEHLMCQVFLLEILQETEYSLKMYILEGKQASKMIHLKVVCQVKIRPLRDIAWFRFWMAWRERGLTGRMILNKTVISEVEAIMDLHGVMKSGN